ncbi:MAG: helix-turn-helix transcriptional regulator [Bacilli bacterium]|jgi:transcriptional regulator with XRE-family HTH domain|nr:helix-turn-helix transcriptional regulator [Bacilli bacterium]MDD4520945.1 helix-turn-helix transcriptional regulator [Bacilli bacterium]MDY0399770.1 helix-turn-helix transcriptional regulator [Bacilli bacterium]
MNIEIANRLVELRKKMGLSQEELADKLGISRQAISKWERAEASPDTDNLICLAKIYGVSLDDLLKTDQPVEEVIRAVKEKENEQQEENVNITIEREIETKDHPSLSQILHSVTALIITVAYVILGVTLGWWGRTWMFFILVPFPGSIVEAIQTRRLSKVNIAVLATFAYLFLGMNLPNGSGWHPYWVIFLAIPLFYSIVRPIEKYIENKKRKE